jgi:hypothetical protein
MHDDTATPPPDPLSKQCPFCGAEPDQQCVTISGRPRPYSHGSRTKLVTPRSESTRRALCCECGNLRTVSARYAVPQDANRAFDDDDHDHPGRLWRMTGTLRCNACESLTRHALLRDDVPRCRDFAENRNDPVPLREDLDELTRVVTPGDLTPAELMALIQVLKPAYWRVRRSRSR